MDTVRDMISTIRNMLARYLGPLRDEKVTDETAYYRKLFVENATWNSPEPNEDELSRWVEIQKMLDSVSKKDDGFRIMDVGCGRGWLANKLSPYGHVTGIEPVAPVIEYAKTLFKQPKFYAMKPDEFIREFPDDKFDIVTCSEVLEHVIEKAGFIGDLKTLLAPGGHLIITTPRAELRKLWERKYGAPPQPIEEWISTDDLLELLRASGFRVLASTTAFAEDIYQIHLAQKAA